MASQSKDNRPPQPDRDSPLGEDLFMGQIIDAMSDGVAVVERNGPIVLVNRALCSMLGYSQDQMLSRGWAELFFEEPENQDFNQTIVEVIQRQHPIENREVSYRTPDGQRRTLLATVSLITDNGELLGLVSLFKDVTELTRIHKSERLLLRQSRRLYEEKQESLDRVSRAVAHEVRNPVTAIGGLATRLLKKSGPNGDQAGYLTRILESTGRLEQIVSQVREYAYLPRPTRRPLDLNSWLAQMLESYGDEVRRLGVELNLYGPDEKILAHWDPDLINTALNNLIENALEAAPLGGEVSLKLVQSHSQAVISITDSGPGISPEDLPYLWDPFFTTKADRVGMSLAITERIISEHGGTLEIDSAPDQGATFIIHLPLGESQDAGKGRPPQHK